MLRQDRRWLMVGLLFLFMLINYADKAVIGLSALPIMRELSLSNTQFGALGSAFFLLFSLSGIIGGFCANHIKSKWILLGLALIWSVAQAPMAGSVSFTTLIAARILLGVGEGPAFPVALNAVYKWFDDKRRTVPTSIIACGAAFGAGIVAPGITFVITRFSWHAAFTLLSLASLTWGAIWLLFGAEGQQGDRPQDEGMTLPRVSYRRLLLCPTALGVFIGGFVAYWAITLNVVWLAAYLVKGAGYSPTEAGWIIVLPSFTQILLAPSLGAWSERLVRRGTSSRIARGILGGACLLTAGLAMALFPTVHLPWAQIPLVALAFATGSVFFTLGSTVIAEISPPTQRGAMLGITNSIHTLAGILAPLVMGKLVDIANNPAAGFQTGFLIAGAFIALGGLLVMALVRPDER